MYQHLVFIFEDIFHRREFVCLIDFSTEGGHPVYRDYVFLVIDIFLERTSCPFVVGIF